MPQMLLPIFPVGMNYINDHIGFQEQEGMVYYFHGMMPVFSHAKEDLASFRFITSQLVAGGNVKLIEISRAFGISYINVKRNVALPSFHDHVGVRVAPRELLHRAGDLDGRVEIEVRARVVRRSGSGDAGGRQCCKSVSAHPTYSSARSGGRAVHCTPAAPRWTPPERLRV